MKLYKTNEDQTWDNGLSTESRLHLMNTEITNETLEHKWNEIQSDYHNFYPELTSEDISYKKGEFNKLIDRIAKHTMRNPKDVQDEIYNWQPSLYRRLK